MKHEREAAVAAAGIGGHVPEEVVDSAGVPYVVKQSRRVVVEEHNTGQVDSNLPLTSKQKFCYNMRPMY